MYDVIDHTADIGIRVRGSSLSDLFVRTAEAMQDVVFHVKRPVRSSIDVPLIVEADSVESLLVKWLQELLFVYETRHLVLSQFWIDEISKRRVVGSAKGVKFDAQRHSQKLEIKAVTYHQLEVKNDDEGNWYATVIFDI